MYYQYWLFQNAGLIFIIKIFYIHLWTIRIPHALPHPFIKIDQSKIMAWFISEKSCSPLILIGINHRIFSRTKDLIPWKHSFSPSHQNIYSFWTKVIYTLLWLHSDLSMIINVWMSMIQVERNSGMFWSIPHKLLTFYHSRFSIVGINMIQVSHIHRLKFIHTVFITWKLNTFHFYAFSPESFIFLLYYLVP